MSVPNRAFHPNRQVNHYEVAHTTPGMGSYVPPERKVQYFDDKKRAKTYAKGVADAGHEVSVTKHTPESQASGYTKGKTARLMEAGLDLLRFVKGNF